MTHPFGTRLAARGVTATAALLLIVASTTTAEAATGSYLRLAHLSPNTPAVDVYVVSAADPQDEILLEGVGYGAVSDYQIVDGGSYTISMRPAGAAESTPPVISTTLTAAEGAAYTVAGTGLFDDLGLTVLTDDLTLPPSGQSRVRVIQAAASQPELDISVDGGPTLGDDVAFATTTGYETVAAGQWTLRVDGGTGSSTTLPLTVSAGAVYSVLILDDGNGGLSVSSRVDAVSSANGGLVPAGGVETGGGATASGGFPAVAVGTLGMVLLLVLAYLAAGRRGRSPAPAPDGA